MKALLGDGRELDLGTDDVHIVGEPGDGDHIVIDTVRGIVRRCDIEIQNCRVTVNGTLYLASNEGTASR